MHKKSSQTSNGTPSLLLRSSLQFNSPLGLLNFVHPFGFGNVQPIHKRFRNYISSSHAGFDRQPPPKHAWIHENYFYAITLAGFIDYIPNINFFGIDQLIYEICSIECPSICDTARIQFMVKDIDKHNDCYVPNIITPNNDGLNDALVIPCLSDYPDNNIRIFNRWGDLVFKTSSYKNNWMSTYKHNPMPKVCKMSID